VLGLAWYDYGIRKRRKMATATKRPTKYTGKTTRKTTKRIPAALL
jgi:hypothetical protein